MSGANTVQAMAQAQGAMEATTDAVKLEGELDAGSYGGVLQARGARRRARRRLQLRRPLLRPPRDPQDRARPLHAEVRARARGARLDDSGGAGMSEFYGKYRGKVENNVDPLQQGRVQVSVPAVLGDGRLSWAMPCAPYAGSQVGFFAVPPVGANIWVEFEAGNPDYPIWSGCFWGSGECPASPALAENKVFKTDAITLRAQRPRGRRRAHDRGQAAGGDDPRSSSS